MRDARHRPRFVIVGLFQPTDAGTSFSRSAWPAHVTLAGNFVVEASLLDVVDAMRRAGLPGSALGVRFGELASFGHRRDIPVRLVTTHEITSIHHRLADELDSLPGFAADEPGHRRARYRPHVTLTPSISVEADESRALRSIALVELDQDLATVVTAWNLDPMRP
ncbi:2'-5' RNA ligase family protein [Clavibacter sp. Sh2126]|uniref:2'-5' RNA ligase family protein n=1 Tax=Clavibacter sp. Sh2126 TaxID=3397678 RepID=UPI0039E0CEA3